jgi:galactokinase
MAHNFLQLNQDKTEVLIVGVKAQRKNRAAQFNSRAIKIKHQVKNLGVILDSELNFKSHIRNVTKIYFYHLRNIVKVQYISLSG